MDRFWVTKRGLVVCGVFAWLALVLYVLRLWMWGYLFVRLLVVVYCSCLVWLLVLYEICCLMVDYSVGSFVFVCVCFVSCLVGFGFVDLLDFVICWLYYFGLLWWVVWCIWFACLLWVGGWFWLGGFCLCSCVRFVGWLTFWFGCWAYCLLWFSCLLVFVLFYLDVLWF